MKRLLMLVCITLTMAMTVPAQDWAKSRLEKSPRHIEWIKVKQGNREISCSIAYPEVKEKAAAVIVIHEIFGLTDWVRGVTDELAEAGYVAIAPDLLSGLDGSAPGKPLVMDAARGAIGSLPPDQITADLNAVLDYVMKLPACNGKVTVAGFCWGGGQTFRFATNNKQIKAAYSFYGPMPTKDEELERIACPVYGFYGGNDARIDSMIPKAVESMKKAGKTYEPVTYEGAGHGFMRAGEDPTDKNPANKRARDEAWSRWKDLLKKI